MNKGKLYHSEAFFTVKTDIPDVRPPFQSGKRDSFWVTTRTPNEDAIREQARHKADMCYGMEIADIEIANQFESEA